MSRVEKSRMSIAKVILLVVCIFVFLCSSAIVVKYFVNKHNRIEMNKHLESLIVTSTEENPTDPNDYSALLEINPDLVGWIKVPGTSINYPVVQTTDNEFYLNHTFEKEWHSYGTIYMDYRNNPTELDANTILYGHNCYNTEMFSELTKYKKLDFYKENPVFEFNTLERNYKWKIYAVFITNATASEDNGYIFNYIFPYMDGMNFDGFINEVNKRRLYVTDVDIRDGDRMLVLSTCVRDLDTFSDGKSYRADARLVVLARAVRDNESVEVNTENAYINKSPKYPQLWYDKHNQTNPYINDEKWYPLEVKD